MRSKIVLIALQEDGWIKSLSTFLHHLGYRVETAKQVGEVIRKVRREPIHVVILEDEMEEVMAADLIPIFKRMDERIQIIVLSSEVSLGLIKRLREAGIFYQAMKPVDLQEIRSAVECAFMKIEQENLKESYHPFLIPGRVLA